MSEGYDVLCAGNGKEALNVLASESPLPDIIYLDLMMPVMDGFEFRAQQLCDARIQTIPIFILTAETEVQKKKIQIGADEAFKKPIDIDNLLETTKRYCSETLRQQCLADGSI